MPERWHGAVDHTADVGLRAAGPDGAALLEEAAAALAQICADVGRTAQRTSVAVTVEAEDLERLVFRWLNELIAVAEERGEALVAAEVLRLQPAASGWLLRGRAWFTPFDGEVRPRLQVKAVTLHRLRVQRGPQKWTLEAFLDV